MVLAERSIPHSQIDLVTHKHHEQLMSTMRYARFIQEETSAEWNVLLGPDVVGLTHPNVVADITQRFLSFNQKQGVTLSTEEKKLLLTAPLIHDWGEMVIAGVGVGDITFDQKTGDHENTELKIFEMVLHTIQDSEGKGLMRTAYVDVVQNRDSRLGRMFNAIERIGYVETAIKAFTGVEGRRIANWRGLVGNVLSNQIEKLLEYRAEYPYVAEVLKQNDDIVERMFADILLDGVPLDNTGTASYDLAKLQKAQKAWESR